jgi:hypothetical protein
VDPLLTIHKRGCLYGVLATILDVDCGGTFIHAATVKDEGELKIKEVCT